MLSVVDKPLHPRFSDGQKPQFLLDSLEPSKRKSAQSGKEDHIVLYHCSPAPQLSHVTRECLEKLVQRGYTQEERFEPFLDGEGFLQSGWSKQELECGRWTNFVIRVDGRDSSKERPERTKSARGRLLNIGAIVCSFRCCISLILF
jgi:hypothetical protein